MRYKRSHENRICATLLQMTITIEAVCETLTQSVKPASQVEFDVSEIIDDLRIEGYKLSRRFNELIEDPRLEHMLRHGYRDLWKSLEDLLQVVYSTARELNRLRFERTVVPTPEMCRLLIMQVREIAFAVAHFKDGSQVREGCMEIDRLGSSTSRLIRMAMGPSLIEGLGAQGIRRRRKLIEGMETASEKAEDIAESIYSLVLKTA